MTRPMLVLSTLFAMATVPVALTCAAEAPDPALEAKLAAAQERLEKAAAEVAELSTQISGPVMRRLFIADGEGRRVIGVQLDPASGSEGARVLHVSPGGPAAEAGMRKGDVIVAVNDAAMTGRSAVAREVTAALRAAPPEQPVKIKVLRDGATQTLSMTPRPLAFGALSGEWPGNFTFAVPAAPPGPGEPPVLPLPPRLAFNMHAAGAVAGLELVTLTPALGEYFGTDKGVLVVRAPKDAALDLRDGDVIQSIGGREPTSGAHATRILASYQPGESVVIKVLRKKKPLTLSAALPD
ncbi:MAG: PDZ domain-containing protein [Steroidobacteraceae bacterium]|nr:PDZ domain-containing protein [Steroidobacteraceae bacterium]MCW5573365.1 PDZ domain-containing protein [Steroidobacteraceae bacterium]